MAHCKGCGGILGRDCWNEIDCVQISESVGQHDGGDIYHHFMGQPIWKTILEILRFRYAMWKHLRRDEPENQDIPF